MPTHTVVLGDLLGSQWIGDEEFERRAERFWGTVFGEGERVPEKVMNGEKEREVEILGENERTWRRRVIAVAGNHDVGYAGDISEARMERFERMFGRANWDVRFEHPPILSSSASAGDQPVTPTLHLINLNSLMFDTPALSAEVQSNTYSYLNGLIADRLSPVEDRSAFTLLLTHLPLHKEDGVWVDSEKYPGRVRLVLRPNPIRFVLTTSKGQEHELWKA